PRKRFAAMSPSNGLSRHRLPSSNDAAGGKVRRNSSLAFSALSTAAMPASPALRAPSRAQGGAYIVGNIDGVSFPLLTGALITLFLPAVFDGLPDAPWRNRRTSAALARLPLQEFLKQPVTLRGRKRCGLLTAACKKLVELLAL